MVLLHSGVVDARRHIGRTFAGGRLIESLLYDVSPRDPIVFLATTVTLMGIAVIAWWLPTLRAARLNLAEVLRMG